MSGVRLLLAAALLGLSAACETPPKPGDAARTVEPAPPFAPTWAEVVAAQEQRLNSLLPFHAAGQIELRWSDRDGSHFEYCRGEVFIRPPSDAALSLTKVGERFLWLGESGENGDRRRFLFDLRTKAPVLWLVGGRPPRTVDAARTARESEASPLVVQQASIFDLLGLMPFPQADALDAVLEGDAKSLMVEFAGVGGPLRVTIDIASRLPTRIEQLDADGALLLTSVLSENESVDRDQMAPGALPKFPSRVVVTTAAVETNSASIDDASRSNATLKPAPKSTAQPTPKEEIRLFLTPTTEGRERIKDRLFDLEALIETFKPVRIEER